MQVVLDSWATNPQGAALHGPIYTIASDGEASFRLAKHLLCSVKELDPDSPLGKILHPLNGFNCFTSKDGIIGSCDPKHIFHRMYSAPLVFYLSDSRISRCYLDAKSAWNYDRGYKHRTRKYSPTSFCSPKNHLA
jgi:hypothetical protein